MVLTPVLKRELDDLLGDLCDQRIVPEQRARLENIIRSDEGARARFVDYIQLCVKLRWTHVGGVATVPDESEIHDTSFWSEIDTRAVAELLDELDEFADEVGEAAAGEVIEPPKVEHKKIKRKKWDAVLPPDNTPLSVLGLSLPWAFGIAAMIGVVATIFFLPAPKALVVATLTRQSVDATWRNGAPTVDDSGHLRAGTMRLTRGRIWITFFNGTQVGIAGPATFTLEEGHRMDLKQGDLVGYCPVEARGFVVRTPGSRVVDLGTEFAVGVDKRGTTDVHVLEGAVDLQLSTAGERSLGHELSAGNALRVDATGTKATEIEFSAAKFKHLRSLLNRNLIVNGDFEADGPCEITVRDESVKSFHNMAMTGWKDDTGATAAPYEMPGATISQQRRDRGTFPGNRGECYFLGIERGTTWQTIDVSALAKEIDAQRIQFELSGWIGGQSNQDDALTVRAIALDEHGERVDASNVGQIGPVTPADRKNRTGLLPRTRGGELPQGTRYVRIDLVSESNAAGSVDAHGDNLSLTLSLRKPATGKDDASR